MAANNGHLSKRFLYVLWDGGGNVQPQLALMRKLVQRGHRVRVLAPQVLQERITAAGCQYVPYNHAPEHDSTSPDRDLLQDWKARTPLGAAACVRDKLMAAPALAFAQDVLSAIATEPTDVVVTDYLVLGAYIGGERASLPVVSCIHHIYPFPAPALPPFGMGFQPATNSVGYLRDAFMGRMFRRFYDGALPAINAVRATLGLPPLTTLFDLIYRADRALVLSSPSFDFPSSALPANVRYVGPQLEVQPASANRVGASKDDDQRPLIVISFSTTFQNQTVIMQCLTKALSTLPVRIVVTKGPAIESHSFDVPSNVDVRSYVPHHEIFPKADLVVTHGGHGTVMQALASGVPLLCVPMGRDQADEAARVVWRGAGLTVSSSATPDAVRKAATRLLVEPQFRAAAQRLAEAMPAEDTELCAVTELETL